jgi:hypothetical protein
VCQTLTQLTEFAVARETHVADLRVERSGHLLIEEPCRPGTGRLSDEFRGSAIAKDLSLCIPKLWHDSELLPLILEAHRPGMSHLVR